MKNQESDVWNDYWQHNVPSDYVNFTPQIIATVAKHVELENCRVLEVGAGTGGDSILLGNMGARVVALDFSPQATRNILTNAAKNSTGKGFVYSVQGDARQLPFETESFDLIFHQGVLEHFRDPNPLLREQWRVLRKGGHVLVDVPQRYTLYTPYKRYRMWRGTWDAGGWETEFSHRELIALLQKVGFKPIDSYGRVFFPYLISGRNQLIRIEKWFFPQKGLPVAIWNYYDAFWHRLERSRIGKNILMSIGVLAQKI